MCFSLPFCSSGCETSSDSTATFTSTNKAVSNVLQSFSSSSTNTVNIAQSITFEVGPKGFVEAENIDLSQTITGKFNFITSVNAEQRNQIVTAVKNDITQQVEAMSKAKNDILSTALAGSSSTNVATTINSLVESNSSLSQINASLNAISTSQGVTVKIEGRVKVKNWTVNQNIALEIAATNIVTSISDAVAQTDIMQKLAQAATSSTETDAAGVSALVGSIGSAISGIISSAIFPFVIGGVVLLAGIYFLASSGGGGGGGKDKGGDEDEDEDEDSKPVQKKKKRQQVTIEDD